MINLSKIASFSFQVVLTEAAREVVVLRASSSVIVPSFVPSAAGSCSAGGDSPAAALFSALSYLLYESSS